MNTIVRISAMLRLLVPLVAVAASAAAVRAQAPMPAARNLTGGLLGQDYAGIEASYIRHHESAPRVMHRYGFMASRPMPERQNLDGIFRYNYTRGSTLGPDGSQHDFMIGAAGFTRQGAISPFLEGDIGWAWARAAGARENSFVYQIRAGVEMLLSPRVSLTPSVAYKEARRFDDHAWLFGARLAFRLNEGWGATLALHLDDAHNVETGVGVQRRF